MTETPAKSGRGGARKGAGRKRKGHVSATTLVGVDLKSALEAEVPLEIETVAQRHATSAVDVLVKLLMHGTSEAAKINAANAVLDRGYGKPSVEAGGEQMLPFLAAPAATGKPVAVTVREEARKYAHLAIAVLDKIATCGDSETARAQAAKSLLDRGLGTVAPAKLPDKFGDRPLGKKEEAAHAARTVATGRYATPAPPRAATDRVQ